MMFKPLDELQHEVRRQRALTLLNLRAGIRADLSTKIADGTLVPPLDTDAVAQDIYDAMNTQPAYKVALEMMRITVSDVKAVLVGVCREKDIKVK